MANEIVNTTTGEIVEKQDYGADKIALLKNTICKGASNDELALFLHVCKKTGLDPFSKQIYAIRRKQGQMEMMTFQVSIDGYRAIAERSGNYAPGPEPTYTYDADGKLLSATVTIKKRVGDQWFDVGATAHYDEYVPKFWDSKEGKWKVSNQLWEKLPRVMLAKCAESAVLRKAFPNELAGTYTDNEMEQAAPVAPQIQMPKPVVPNDKK